MQDLRNVGEIEKIRIGHENDGAFPDWCLEEVQVENLATHERLVFPADVWLAKNAVRRLGQTLEV